MFLKIHVNFFFKFTFIFLLNISMVCPPFLSEFPIFPHANCDRIVCIEQFVPSVEIIKLMTINEVKIVKNGRR